MVTKAVAIITGSKKACSGGNTMPENLLYNMFFVKQFFVTCCCGLIPRLKPLKSGTFT